MYVVFFSLMISTVESAYCSVARRNSTRGDEETLLEIKIQGTASCWQWGGGRRACLLGHPGSELRVLIVIGGKMSHSGEDNAWDGQEDAKKYQVGKYIRCNTRLLQVGW